MTEIKQKLQSACTFREWHGGDWLEYCESRINFNTDDVIILNQEEYVHKVKPILITKEQMHAPDALATEKEKSLLQGMIES